MIKNNLIGQALIGLIVVLLLISSFQMFGWGQGIDSVEVSEENLTAIPAVPKSTPLTAEVESQDKTKTLEDIGLRPMFSPDRTPFVETQEVDVGIIETPEINELKAQLTGVVITPEQSYAMILDTTNNQRETYKIGMPLDGEQGGWTLDSIQSRKVTFISDDDRTAELVLEVYGKQLKLDNKSNSSRSSKRESENNKADQSQKIREEKKKNADDIRKKIAERRAQMRAEAAKKNK